MGLFDTCLMMEQAGRRLASVPLAEAIVALRILGQLGGDAATRWIDAVRGEQAVVTLALRKAAAGKEQLVPGAAVAAAILTFDGKEIAIEEPAGQLEAPFTLGGSAVGRFVPGERISSG